MLMLDFDVLSLKVIGGGLFKLIMGYECFSGLWNMGNFTSVTLIFVICLWPIGMLLVSCMLYLLSGTG